MVGGMQPDSIVFTIGQTPETIYDQLIADTGDAQSGVTSERVPLQWPQ